MRITCPTCGAAYRVDDSAIGPNGRNVQCDACGAQWRQAPAPRSEEDDLAAEISRFEAEDEDEDYAPARGHDAGHQKTPGLEEAAELLKEMREESARTDTHAIFGDKTEKTEDAAAAESSDREPVSEADLRATIVSAKKENARAARQRKPVVPQRAEGAEAEAAEKSGGSGFKVGFFLGLAVIAVLAFGYVARGPLSAQFPGAAPALGTYAGMVDSVRGGVEALATMALSDEDDQR